MDRANDSRWLPALGLAFLTYNSAAAVLRSVDDPWAVGFVVVAYVDLLLLFWCLRKFERSTESNRGGLKAAVWFLATLLTGMFAHKVAAIMPWPVAAIVYCMAAATAGGGFWAFFIYREPVDLSPDAKPYSNYRVPVDLSADAKPSSN